MEARLRLLCIIVTIGCFTFGLPLYGVGLSSPAQPFLWGKLQDRTLGCTKEALTALKSIPKLNYRCGEEQQDEIKFDSSNEVSGDQSVRFLVVPDPCVKYSYITRRAIGLSSHQPKR